MHQNTHVMTDPFRHKDLENAIEKAARDFAQFYSDPISKLEQSILQAHYVEKYSTQFESYLDHTGVEQLTKLHESIQAKALELANSDFSHVTSISSQLDAFSKEALVQQKLNDVLTKQFLQSTSQATDLSEKIANLTDTLGHNHRTLEDYAKIFPSQFSNAEDQFAKLLASHEKRTINANSLLEAFDNSLRTTLDDFKTHSRLLDSVRDNPWVTQFTRDYVDTLISNSEAVHAAIGQHLSEDEEFEFSPERLKEAIARVTEQLDDDTTPADIVRAIEESKDPFVKTVLTGLFVDFIKESIKYIIIVTMFLSPSDTNSNQNGSQTTFIQNHITNNITVVEQGNRRANRRRFTQHDRFARVDGVIVKRTLSRKAQVIGSIRENERVRILGKRKGLCRVKWYSEDAGQELTGWAEIKYLRR